MAYGNQMKNKQPSVLGGIFVLIVVAAIVIGWVLNIVKLVEVIYDPLNAMTILRIVGIFVPPLGAIFGYL